jgi:hypothetical protein
MELRRQVRSQMEFGNEVKDKLSVSRSVYPAQITPFNHRAGEPNQAV